MSASYRWESVPAQNAADLIDRIPDLRATATSLFELIYSKGLKDRNSDWLFRHSSPDVDVTTTEDPVALLSRLEAKEVEGTRVVSVPAERESLLLQLTLHPGINEFTATRHYGGATLGAVNDKRIASRAKLFMNGPYERLEVSAQMGTTDFQGQSQEYALATTPLLAEPFGLPINVSLLPDADIPALEQYGPYAAVEAQFVGLFGIMQQIARH